VVPDQQELPSLALTAAQFLQLVDMPPALTWFANIDNPQTRRAYQADLSEFMAYSGIERPEQFRIVTRALARLAPRSGAPRPVRRHDPAQAGRPLFPVRLSVRS
jgi:hypothetical protein